MKKLDWYIIRTFLTTFFFAIILFTIIAVVIDVSEKLDDFVRINKTFTQIATDYYAAFIPHIVALLFPLFVFISVIFFTSKMAGRSEIIAILASGVSLRRILRPYFLASITLAILLWFAGRYIIPRSEVKRTSFKERYIDNSYGRLINKGSNHYFRIDSFTYAGIRYFDETSQSGGPFFMHRIKGDRLLYNLRAETLKWDSAAKKWTLYNVFERTISGLKESTTQSSQKEMNFNKLVPADLIKDDWAKDKMTTPVLQRRIVLEKLRGTEGLSTLEMELHRRNATPVSVIILTLMGAIVACRRVRGGSGLHLAGGFIVAALFILMDKFSTVFCINGNLPAIIAAWIPNTIFSFVAYYLYRKAPK